MHGCTLLEWSGALYRRASCTLSRIGKHRDRKCDGPGCQFRAGSASSATINDVLFPICFQSHFEATSLTLSLSLCSWRPFRNQRAVCELRSTAVELEVAFMKIYKKGFDFECNAKIMHVECVAWDQPGARTLRLNEGK